ncbi:ESX secretion-associated protein EspG [Nocardia gipuzkoensis]|uniref:ESX secretion-associated protein EspG n=1 Tax=Nocardia gipuzkoensis TaxID=2749991 RepID=UPI003EE0CDEA
MKRTWRFTDVEFDVLWEPLREDALPRPFTILSRIPYYEDYLRAQYETRERLRATLDPAFDGVLDVVARPDIRVVVRGIDGKNPANPEGSIQMQAVRRGDEGYLLKQLPGETIEHSAGFTITECDPLKLADVVATELPDVGAGKGNRITLPVAPEDDHMDHEYGDSRLWDTFEDTSRQSAERFLRTVPTTVGGIEISQGHSRFGPRGQLTRGLEWRDLPDDGRYVITQDTPPTAVPADSKQLVAMINTEIAAIIRVIKDEWR